jgi:hypothetical protein
LLPAEFALAAGFGHAFAGAQVADVGFERRPWPGSAGTTGRNDLFPVIDRGAQPEQNTAFGQIGEDGVGVGDVAREAVELGDGEDAPGPEGGQRLI